MKKVLFGLLVMVALTSCTSVKQTSTYGMFDVKAIAPVVADLDISKEKIVYSYTSIPSRIRLMGLDNIINSAVLEALKANNDADVFVGLETQVKYQGPRVVAVVVSGYPAKYKSFTTIDENMSLKDVILLSNSTQDKK